MYVYVYRNTIASLSLREQIFIIIEKIRFASQKLNFSNFICFKCVYCMYT